MCALVTGVQTCALPICPRRPLAVGFDFRTRDFGVDSLLGELDRLAADADLDLRILFLDCDDEVLIRRYTETCRRHPLDGERPVPDMIRLERRLLMRLRDRAAAVIDRSEEHTSVLQTTMRISYAVFCMKK